MQNQKTVTTRKDTREAKITTRAMANERKPSLSEVKQKSRQRMVKSPGDSSTVKDIYDIALSSLKMVKGPTGIVYHDSMAEHRCLWDENYPECPERYTSVIQRCREMNLIERCQELTPRQATKDEILMVHDEAHYQKLEDTKNCQDLDHLEDLSSNYDAIYIHPSTFDLSLLACGSTIELVDSILDGKVQNGMAVIRPPGHHAMEGEFNGYCFFNNVAVAARHAIYNKGLKRILIVDWDVHHGQGTQRAFYDDPRVVYFSIHRFEHGTFWPNLRESDFDAVGEGDGKGRNINVPLNKIGMKNEDYLAIFQQLLMPVAIEFQPELILVSAGYDAALGCLEGEMEVTPAGYTHLLSSLMSLACGRVAVVLEGGYCLESLAEGAALTLRTLLGDPCPVMEPLEAPSESIQDTIYNCIYAHRDYWRNLCLQDRYNLVEVNNVNPQPNLHKVPHDSFIGGNPPPEKFETRNCYPVQSETFKREVAEKLKNLKNFTNLTFADNRVCFVYDAAMMEHKNDFESDHPERPLRIQKIFDRFKEYNLLSRMKQLPSRDATIAELSLVHHQSHVSAMSQIVHQKDLQEAARPFDSIYLHKSSFDCAKMSAGSLLQVVDDVLNGDSRTGVAVIRPPGHHAESDSPCGFCFFNNVAVAAKYAIDKFGKKKILIVDWDIHHGNGTQHIFYDSPNVLYISLHKYENGTFFPSSTDGDFTMVGEGSGKGFNVNIPWNSGRMGDTEYLLAFQAVIMPIAYEYDPELVIVSAGFDAAEGDPLGKYHVTPEAYGQMTHWLSALANGRIILALEGGYNVNSISHSMAMCTKALLGDPLPMIQNSNKKVHPKALETIRNVLNIQKDYWKCLKFNKKLPDYDVNENKMGDDLVLKMESMSIGDSDESGRKKDEASGSEAGYSEAAGSSRSSEPSGSSAKKQTLSDFLAENFEALNSGEMFAVTPRSDCPHLSILKPEDAPESFDHNSECSECSTAIENWICLICFKTFCSRYIGEHSVLHSISTDHPLALSYTDLSVWCYKCDAYIDNPQLFKFKNLAHRSKFVEDLVWSYGPSVIDLTADDSE